MTIEWGLECIRLLFERTVLTIGFSLIFLRFFPPPADYETQTLMLLYALLLKLKILQHQLEIILKVYSCLSCLLPTLLRNVGKNDALIKLDLRILE